MTQPGRVDLPAVLSGRTHDRSVLYPERTGGACSGNSSLSAVLCQNPAVAELTVPKAVRPVADGAPGHQ